MSKTLFNRRLERESFGTFPLALPFVHTAMYPVQSPVSCVWCGRMNMRYPDEVNYCRNDICKSFVVALEVFKLGMLAVERRAVEQGWDEVDDYLRDAMGDMNTYMFRVYEQIMERKSCQS